MPFAGVRPNRIERVGRRRIQSQSDAAGSKAGENERTGRVGLRLRDQIAAGVLHRHAHERDASAFRGDWLTA